MESGLLSNGSWDSGPAAAEKYVILTVCVLSALGSILIISSWMFFKSIRSRSRHILVCLSVADLGVAISNATGLLGSHHPDICEWQAGAASFFGASCLLWTIALAFYLFAAVVLQWQVIKQVKIMIAFYVICWGIPVIVTSLLIGLSLLGGDPSEMTSWQGWWCLLKSNISHVDSAVFIFLCSELWACLAYIVVPILYFLTRRHIHRETRSGDQFVTSGSMTAVQSVDRKLMLLPMVFILLHVWSSIMTGRQLYYMFTREMDPQLNHPDNWYKALHFLQGVGDSAQGFCNGLLFVAFTKKVRALYIDLFRRRRRKGSYEPQLVMPSPTLYYQGGSATASPPIGNDSGIGDAHSLNSSDGERTPLLIANR